MKHSEVQPAIRNRPGGRFWLKALVYIAVIAGWYGLSRVFPPDAWLLKLLSWMEGLGAWGAVVFALLYVPSCVLMLPDVLPNAAAGAIWGIGAGTIAVSVGRVLGSTATFLLARGIAGGLVARSMAGDPKFTAVAEAVGRDGFRFVVLLRLCPLFPTIMLNYLLGLTRVRLGAYVAGTLLGMLPRTVVVAYVGAGARSLADLSAGNTLNVAAHPVLFWGGLALSLVVAVLLAFKARRLVKETTG